MHNFHGSELPASEHLFYIKEVSIGKLFPLHFARIDLGKRIVTPAQLPKKLIRAYNMIRNRGNNPPYRVNSCENEDEILILRGHLLYRNGTPGSRRSPF